MNFHFTNICIWLENGKRRTLEFLPNKVNVITGDSLTGKTAVLDIVDYCFFASKHSISEADINEHAAWYGITFTINGKSYTIARQAPDKNAVSGDYFFSSIGEIPDKFPVVNNTEAALKRTLSAEFQIDQDTKISYGGKMLKAGSKISLRYFLLFNTISGDIIEHTTNFFDKQNESRYREALPRTFDLAVGIDTVSNILKREKRTDLEKQLKKLERESDTKSKKQELFLKQASELERKAREFGLVEDDVSSEDSMALLKEMVESISPKVKEVQAGRHGEISSEISKISLKIGGLKRFSSEYSRYKNSLRATDDSLKAVEFISDKHTSLVQTSIFSEILDALKMDQAAIKNAVKVKNPIDSNISDLIKNLEHEKRQLQQELSHLPENTKPAANENEKFFFLGEIKAKLDLYAPQPDQDGATSNDKQDDLQSQIDTLDVMSVEERKSIFVSTMNDITHSYLQASAAALGKYAKYKTYFDYREKRLYLKRSTSLSTENIGGSSNDMFLHLFFFLGLHRIIQSNDVPHVAPFLIIDQFSRPYWGDKNDKKDEIDSPDVAKVKIALDLLNEFINESIEDEKSFQMIVLEHIPETYWEGKENIHLVDSFTDGNALVPHPEQPNE
ncbi:DUF3732 domain-containing protein [Yoonia sp. I 8.24]|uniref:DUF3732 domain-containing protein n=1 Tax=Yoonia sp. I 8.24 TaxID=1537229 RepID=UPI001EDE1518|nr:DUF3732 domain-containing protein [Yoonia sp. I 8.24]